MHHLGWLRIRKPSVSFLSSVGLVLFVLLAAVHIVLLHFGVAYFSTTVFGYISALLLVVGIIRAIEVVFKIKASSNIVLLLFSIWFSVFASEFLLRFVFKKNLTYHERVGGHYSSYYGYLSSFTDVVKHIFKQRNYWYLTEEPNAEINLPLEGRSFIHRYNSLGLRDNEIPVATDNLIIGLGDSFTEGIGTNQDSTWLRFLEKNINNSSSTKIKTLNAGVQGSDPYFEYVLLEHLLQTYKPKLVLLSVNTSDIDDIVIRGGSERFKPNGKVEFRNAPYWEKLYAVSFIFRAIVHSTKQLDWSLLTMEEKEGKSHQALDSIEACIKQFSDLARKNKFKLATIFHPREVEVVLGKFALDSLALKLKADSNFTIINLKDEFVSSGSITPLNASKYYWPTDLHHNTEGYKIWADIITPLVQKEMQ